MAYKLRISVLSADAVLEEVKCERLEEIAINGNPEKFFLVGAQLPPREKEELLAFLRRNIDAVSEEAKCERLEEIAIDSNPKKFFQVRTQLPLREKEELLVFLRNIDVFTWNAYEALGVDPYFICHHLNVNPAVLSRKQPPWCSSKDHYDAVKDEVMKLKQARTIKEIFYPEWLANIVVVKKKNGKWRVCVDFIDLNKTCPNDPFPMPQID